MENSTVEEIVNKTLEAKRLKDIEQVKNDLTKMAVILTAVYVVVKVNNKRKNRKIRKSK
jgi:hypothetical protein